VPVRQWVLSVPWELRGLLAARADALGAASRFFAEEIEKRLRRVAKKDGIARRRSGAIMFVQRFGSMNLNVHFHVLVPDGVFSRANPVGRAAFHGTPAPTSDDLSAIALRVHERKFGWLGRRRLLDDGNGYAARPDPSALDGRSRSRRWRRASSRPPTPRESTAFAVMPSATRAASLPTRC
jgi:hypothetical protein